MCENSQSPCASKHGAIIQIHQVSQLRGLCRVQRPLAPSMAQLVQTTALRGRQRGFSSSPQSLIAEHGHRNEVIGELRRQIGALRKSYADGCGEHILNRAVRSLGDALQPMEDPLRNLYTDGAALVCHETTS